MQIKMAIKNKLGGKNIIHYTITRNISRIDLTYIQINNIGLTASKLVKIY